MKIMERLFKSINGEHPEMPSVIRYRTSTGSKVVVEFGIILGSPATRYSIRDHRGRLTRQGESFGDSFDSALVAGLGNYSRRGRLILNNLLPDNH